MSTFSTVDFKATPEILMGFLVNQPHVQTPVLLVCPGVCLQPCRCEFCPFLIGHSGVRAAFFMKQNMKWEGAFHRLGDNANIRLYQKNQQVKYSEEA